MFRESWGSTTSAPTVPGATLGLSTRQFAPLSVLLNKAPELEAYSVFGFTGSIAKAPTVPPIGPKVFQPVCSARPVSDCFSKNRIKETISTTDHFMRFPHSSWNPSSSYAEIQDAIIQNICVGIPRKSSE